MLHKKILFSDSESDGILLNAALVYELKLAYQGRVAITCQKCYHFLFASVIMHYLFSFCRF